MNLLFFYQEMHLHIFPTASAAATVDFCLNLFICFYIFIMVLPAALKLQIKLFMMMYYEEN